MLRGSGLYCILKFSRRPPFVDAMVWAAVKEAMVGRGNGPRGVDKNEHEQRSVEAIQASSRSRLVLIFEAQLLMGYPCPPGIIHSIWGWVIWVWVISGYGHG